LVWSTGTSSAQLQHAERHAIQQPVWKVCHSLS
jgi:hypothetical protein